jgi:hypothetical protein
MTEELFVTGVYDKKSGYSIIWALDTPDICEKIYNAAYNSAKRTGLNEDYIFIMPFPPDDEVVEKLKLDQKFLKWLFEQSKLILKK